MSEGHTQTRITKYILVVAILAIGSVFSFSAPAEAAAGVNKQINFQGKVTNTDGTNVTTASYTFLFCLYTAASPATPCTSGADNDAVWRESKSITVTDGIFQTNLGDTTTLPGSVDFNTDNIYLGINFNANGQMTPLVRFTAAPYAMNADKVHGLSVTDTTGTLTIPNGKTISFADAFTTSGAFATTLTSTGITNVTLPTTGTLSTLAGAETLTNKVSYNGLVITANTGAITTGTWNGTDIAVADGGTGTSTGSITGTTALTFTAGGTAQNVNLVSSTTGAAVISSTTATTDTLKLQPTAGAASFAGIITTADLTASDKTYTFPDSSITVNAAADISGTTLASNVVTSSLTTVGTLGSLTVSGAITVNGGVSLSASQSLAAAALAYIDLGLITHSTTANQGLRLPNAASAAPSSPTSGEGYLAWDAAGNQLIAYNGSAWAAVGGGSGYSLIKDEAASLTARTTLAFLGAGVTCADSGSQTECTIAGGSGGDLQTTYGGDADGSNATISLTSADDSLVFSNPASAGTDGTFTVKVEQLNTGIANDALYVDNRGTGNGLRIDDASGDTTPFIVDADGRVGIGTSSISTAAATERLLQVGSETNRGNSVTYGEVVTKGMRDVTGLTSIKDVYVYDTTADSDGGRWIDWATTDKLSWYTETLDDSPSDPCVIATDDRCYKASFPRKAILVVTSDALYIFDAQDNALWMKFSQNASGYALGVDTNNDPSSVTAQNGVIYVGTNGTAAGGLYVFDFTSDRMWNYDGTDRSGADVGMGSRNSVVTYNSDNNTNFDIATVGTVADWVKINDVSVAVMQFSTTAILIGSTTNIGPGNGTTLVALATDSGLTVINLSRQRIVQYSDATDNDYNSVVITRTGKLYGLNEALAQAEKWISIDQDQVSEVNGTPDKIWDQASTPALSKNAPTIAAGAPDALEVVERGSLADGGLLSVAATPGSSDLIYVGTDQGLTEIHDHSTVTSGWSKFFNTTKQTSLMPGTIKRAHMMDDASGDLTDDSFRVNTMAPIGGVTYGINGVRGKAVTLNGTSGFFCSDNGGATCAADVDDNMSTTAWNMQMWFKHSTTQAGTDVLYSRCYNTTPAAAAACVTVYMTASGTMVAAYDDDATWTAYSSYDAMLTSTRTYNDNQWHHMVMARDNANDLHFFLDGTPIVSSNATGSTLTLDASQIVAIGADCSVGAACATGANFWDGSIDDFTFSQGTTVVDALTGAQARRLYNDARPLVNKKVIAVTDATTATSTTLGDSGEAWIPNEFAGQVMEITGGTGVGQTRRVIANTATILTVSPAFDTTPDTTSDFEINPEVLYGASNGVTAIGITGESAMGEARQMCVGTNSATDTGGVTCFNHQAGPNLVADVYHADAKQVDDSSAEWTGTDYDDIQSLDISGRAMIIGSMAHFWTETQDVRLGQGMDYLSNKIFDLTNSVKNLGMQTLAGSGSIEVGLTGGADLAENYYSDTLLDAGTVVALDSKNPAYVNQTAGAYQKDMIGIVATSPGIVLGDLSTNGYPIALVGRVPVKVTNENGQIYAGDRLTSASRPGYAMLATQSGRVIGEALGDTIDWAVCEGENTEDINAKLCTTVLVFVNLTDYSGMTVELAMTRTNTDNTADQLVITGLENSSPADALSADGATVRLATAEPTREEKILTYLKQVRDENTKKNTASSEIFTGRVSASDGIITPTLFADQIFAKSIKADSIEGLAVWTNQISSLEEKYAGLNAVTADVSKTDGAVQEQLAIAMKKLSADSITVQLDGSILGKLTVAGALHIGGDAEFTGDTLFTKLSTFLGNTLFKGTVAFEKAPTFGNNTAGFAVVKKGERKVRVVFDEKYLNQPIVAVSLTNDVSPLLDDKADKDLKADIALVEKDYLDTVFDADMKYIVTEKSVHGFTIVLNRKAPADLQFSWVALLVKKANTAVSLDGDESEEIVTEEPPVVLPETPIVVEPLPLPAEPVLPPEETVIPSVDTEISVEATEETAPSESIQ